MMNRRNFLKNTSATEVGITSLLAGVGQAFANQTEKATEYNEGKFADAFELNEISIVQLQQLMKTGKQTARSITQAYLKRIAAIDQGGPQLRAVIEINPDALAIADAMDAERRAGNTRGMLHGIPVLIKENIDTADKMMTTAGSLALLGHHARRDAFVVKQLRDAGAVILGKTNLSEWANFRSTRSSSGWSSRGGQTRNPCVLDRNPCGSSSGSAVAVAANLCAVAIGTETDGSVIAPASFNGIVAIKPTVGLVSRSGIIPISKTQDTAGPMARTVRDAAILLKIMTGIDPSDEITMSENRKAANDYTIFLDANGLSEKKIGVEKSFLEGHEGVVSLFKNAIELLKAKGATIVEVELRKEINKLKDAEFLVLQYEFKDGLNKYLANANTTVKSLADVIAFNKKNEAGVMPYFKQELLEMSEAKGDLDSADYTEALKKSTSAAKLIDDLMKEHGLDAIAGTSIGPANCTDLVNGDQATGFYFPPAAAMAGYPHITVPMGTVHELPVGLSFIAGAYKEDELLKIAYAYEQASKKRAAPKFLKTIAV